MSWDDLNEKLKTPEEKQAEADRKKREQHAENFRAASQALSVIRRAFLKAQQLLARKYGPFMGVRQEGDDSFLDFPEHTLSAKRSEDGAGIVFTCDGKETQFPADRVRVTNFDSFVERQISSLVAP